MNESLIEQALAILQRYVDEKHGGSRRAATIALGMNPTTGLLGKWLRKERVPSMTSLAPILEKLGVCLNMPGVKQPAAPTKDVCFVNARIVPAGEGIEPPQAEDYIAAPLVGEVGAGRGYIAQEDVESWFLVYRHALPAAHSKDLFAVKIGPQSVSMQPTLNPGDIVLVDKEVQHVEAFLGRMMLVKEPDKESGMIKRVELTPAGDDTLVTFYSDNAARFRPMVYSLRDEYDGDLNNAIVGRVIWAWSDVRNK